MPRPPVNADEEKTRSVIASRESLDEEIEKNARLNRNYLLLVIFSTVVAAIGLIEDNVAVLIGAGDTPPDQAFPLTNAAGLGLAIGMSILIGVLSSSSIYSHELLSRTAVGLDSIALALASGAAAVLSLTTGLPSVLAYCWQ